MVKKITAILFAFFLFATPKIYPDSDSSDKSGDYSSESSIKSSDERKDSSIKSSDADSESSNKSDNNNNDKGSSFQWSTIKDDGEGKEQYVYSFSSTSEGRYSPDEQNALFKDGLSKLLQQIDYSNLTISKDLNVSFNSSVAPADMKKLFSNVNLDTLSAYNNSSSLNTTLTSSMNETAIPEPKTYILLGSLITLCVLLRLVKHPNFVLSRFFRKDLRVKK